MDQQHDGVSSGLLSSKEITTSATTADLLMQIASIINHPSSMVGQTTQEILWQVARDAIIQKVREQRNNTSKQETKNINDRHK
jgi:hypothetical protein